MPPLPMRRRTTYSPMRCPTSTSLRTVDSHADSSESAPDAARAAAPVGDGSCTTVFSSTKGSRSTGVLSQGHALIHPRSSPPERDNIAENLLGFLILRDHSSTEHYPRS